MNVSRTTLALLLAVAAFGASAQTTGAAQGQPATGETYRPSLDGQQASTPAPALDMRPMTQEEKATGRQEPSRLKDIDPSTHPAPQNVRPPAQLAPTPRVNGTTPPAVATPVAPAPAPVGSTSSSIKACTGATCTDTGGATTTTQTGNATVNSNGRLCNRTGNTMQCF